MSEPVDRATVPSPVPEPGAGTPTEPTPALRLAGRTFAVPTPLVMAIVNRTRDSFYDRGATFDLDNALQRVNAAVAEGADIVDIGGVKAGPGEVVDAAEESARVSELVAAVRDQHPQMIISVDTWRAEVADAVCRAGAHLINDVWSGHDPELAVVAGERGVGLVCAHTGGLTPRTGPFRTEYDDVVAAVTDRVLELADRAVAAGVHPDAVVLDPAHDFGKNTWHSLEITRRLDALTGLGRAVLVSVSNKDFLGEALDLPVGERVEATLATTAVCAWHGASIHRVHQVGAVRRVIDMIAAIRGDRPPTRAVRGLA